MRSSADNNFQLGDVASTGTSENPALTELERLLIKDKEKLLGVKARREQVRLDLEAAEVERSEVALEAALGDATATKALKVATNKRNDIARLLDDIDAAAVAANLAIRKRNAAIVLEKVKALGTNVAECGEKRAQLFAQIIRSRDEMFSLMDKFLTVTSEGRSAYGTMTNVAMHSGLAQFCSGDAKRHMALPEDALANLLVSAMPNGIYNSLPYERPNWRADVVEVERAFWADFNRRMDELSEAAAARF
jgi:hypothetical protein